MKPKDQDRLLILSIAALCLAALVYGGIAMIAWLAGHGVSFKDFDGAAWTQAVGSVAAIGALVWQRSQEVSQDRAKALQQASEQQDGAHRLVLAAANLCAEFAADEWPRKVPLSDSDCGVFIARVQALGGALRRVDAHSLPRWEHTEGVLVAISAMESLQLEISREVHVSPIQGLGPVKAAVFASSWVPTFKGMASAFAAQLYPRASILAEGLDVVLDVPPPTAAT